MFVGRAERLSGGRPGRAVGPVGRMGGRSNGRTGGRAARQPGGRADTRTVGQADKWTLGPADGSLGWAVVVGRSGGAVGRAERSDGRLGGRAVCLHKQSQFHAFFVSRSGTRAVVWTGGRSGGRLGVGAVLEADSTPDPDDVDEERPFRTDYGRQNRMTQNLLNKCSQSAPKSYRR